MPKSVKKDIARLDVTVDHHLRVDVVEGAGNGTEPGHQGHRPRLVPSSGQSIFQATTGQELEHRKRYPSHSPHVGDLDDMRVR